MISLAALCACDRASKLDYQEQRPSEISIARLRAEAVGVSTIIRDDISVRGRVTANDAYGEYYKAVVIEDASGGIEIELDAYALYAMLPLYAEVTVHCQGLAIGRYGRMLELGAPPAGEYPSDRIAYGDIMKYITLRTEASAPVEPQNVQIALLDDSHIGRTVRIGCLHAAVPGLCWADTDYEGRYVDTQRRVVDADGRSIAVSISANALYAHEPMPAGEFSLTGIVEYHSAEYTLRITNRGIEEVREQ
ncbi:MAG: hypothetical protein J1D86_01955 [Alistipes sp.]|nr:hypothetical protein [Alistipes sp.]